MELPYSPEGVEQRLLRKPEFLYSMNYTDVGDSCSWLYLWRCNEGWNHREYPSPREFVAQIHARHNMGLHVVLHALTEG